MARTYRTLRYTMGPIDVDRPEWAQCYAVGDEIAYRRPDTARMEIATVAGFSIRDEHYGAPVIDAREIEGYGRGTVVVTEVYHLDPEFREQLKERGSYDPYP